MVAVIKTGHSILRILNYNENKVKEGLAEFIGEGNYPVDTGALNFSMKHKRLQRQLELNRNVSRGSVHISLNFDPSEAAMPKEKLLKIAATYMEKIGFGEQPYLVYQHYDAGHPHIHLVSIKVRADGSRIDMQNIGRNQSEKARKEIETVFGLLPAEGSKQKEPYSLQPVAMSKIQYGKTETKKALDNVLRGVLKSYRYTSIHELNAVLKLYNVMADRGSEGSRIYKGGGLVFRVLDEEGKPMGVPVKASDFYYKPTLRELEKKFTENQVKRVPHKTRIKLAVDQALSGKPIALEALISGLEKQGIQMALRQNNAGQIYGITYIDHQTKVVFNGSVLGKSYSAKAILERCLQKEQPFDAKKQQKLTKDAPVGMRSKTVKTTIILNPEKYTDMWRPISMEKDLIEQLLPAEPQADYLAYGFRRRRKKKKRKV